MIKFYVYYAVRYLYLAIARVKYAVSQSINEISTVVYKLRNTKTLE